MGNFFVMHKKYYKTLNGCRTPFLFGKVFSKRKRVYVIQRFQLCNATLLHCLENSEKTLQRGVLLSLDTNGFLHQPLYSSDIFRRNLIVNLIPFSMTTWVLLNFWNSNASIKTVFFCYHWHQKVYTQTSQLMTL